MTQSSSPPLPELEQRLEEELVVRQTLYDHLMKLHKAIVECDGPTISEQRDRLKDHLNELERQRQRRDHALGSVARALQLTDSAPSLRVIAKKLPSGEKARVQQLRENLRELAERTELLNRKNQVLLKGGMEVVDHLLDSFLADRKPSGGYGPQGDRVKASREAGFLNTRA